MMDIELFVCTYFFPFISIRIFYIIYLIILRLCVRASVLSVCTNTYKGSHVMFEFAYSCLYIHSIKYLMCNKC